MLAGLAKALVLGLLGVGLVACARANAPTPQPAAAATTVAAPSVAPTPQAPREACDDPRRGRECLKHALRLRWGEAERDAALTRACRAGYQPGCYFLQRFATDQARLEYIRRGCAYVAHGTCSKLVNDIRKGKVDPSQPTEQFGYRWVTQATRLTVESRTSVELIAHRGARLILLEQVGDTAFALVTAFAATDDYESGDALRPRQSLVDSRPDDSVVVALSASLLSKNELPLAAPELRSDAVDHKRLLYGAPDAIDQGVSLSCGALEILNDLPGSVQQLRQLRDGIELRGFTRIPLEWSWDSNSCLPRLIEDRDDDSSTPPVPPDHVPLDPAAAEAAVRYLKTGKPLYSVELSDTGAKCAERKLVGGQLTLIERTGAGAARREISYGTHFSGGSLVQLTGPAIDEFDARGKKTDGGAFGCMSFFHFVQSTPDALLLFHAWTNPLVSYHPDDATPWFKTKASCEHAIAAHPRVRLTPGQRSPVASVALRLTGGC